MELPDFIRTEWKDKGSVEVHFLNSKVINMSPRSFSSQLDSITDSENEPSKSFYDKKFSYTNENHMLNNIMTPGIFSVQCSFSTFNIWEYEAKSYPHLINIDLRLHNQVTIEDNDGTNVKMYLKKLKESDLPEEDHKYLNENYCSSLMSSENILINDVMQCLESKDMKMSNKIASKLKHKAKNNSCSSKHPTWQPGGVAWALQYCQKQTRDANQMHENANNDNNKIYKADGKKIGNYIINNVFEFLNIVWVSVFQLMSIFDFGSVISAFYTRIFKGSASEKDKKYSLQINRMEVKALKNMRSYIGNLIKVYPRTPLLCEKYGMIVQKVKLDSKYSILNRGRIDELIRISCNSSQADLTLEKESNKSSGLYVTYLSQQDVQYILDKQWMEKSALHDDDILQPFQTEFKYVASETNHGEQFMLYHQMLSKVVQDFRLLQFIEDPSLSVDIPQEIPKSVENYWIQRHRLFLRYDDGICLDEESWYSVTPEIIAAHQAQRCACDIVIDAFCGAGGNAIQLAAYCNKVIAIDIDPKKIELAQNNARVYGVLDRIEFIVGDFVELAPNLKGDVVFMSPPWGGMSYNKKITYDIFTLDGTLNGEKIFEAASAISSDIALFLPKSANIFQAILLAGPDGRVDLEYAHISNKRKGLTVYYGNLVDFNYDDEEFEY